MSSRCSNRPPVCVAATKLRKWLNAGGKGVLTLVREDFANNEFSLSKLLFSGPLPERLAQRWRSFCAWMGHYTPFTGWKEFWFRRAGANIGKNVFFSPGTEIDLLFPQLVTLEDGAVMGLGALIVAHVYTPDKIVVARATVKRNGLVGGRAILAITTIGEEGILAPISCTMLPVPEGNIAVGVPAVCHERKAYAAKKEKENDDRP